MLRIFILLCATLRYFALPDLYFEICYAFLHNFALLYAILRYQIWNLNYFTHFYITTLRYLTLFCATSLELFAVTHFYITILHYLMLRYTVLSSIFALPYATLHFITVSNVTLSYLALLYTIFNITLFYIPLCYLMLLCNVLQFPTLFCATLRYFVLYATCQNTSKFLPARFALHYATNSHFCRLTKNSHLLKGNGPFCTTRMRAASMTNQMRMCMRKNKSGSHWKR